MKVLYKEPSSKNKQNSIALTGQYQLRRGGAARRIAKNFFSLTAGNLLCKFLAFICTAYVARTLTIEGFGIIGFSQAALVYFQLLINQGLDTYGTRETARYPEKTAIFVNNIVSMRLILAAASYALLVLFTVFLAKPYIVKAAILIMGIRLFELSFNLKWVFQGIEKMEWIAASRILQQLVYAGAVFAIIRGPGDILRVPMLQVAAAGVGALMLFIVYMKLIRGFKFTLNAELWKKFFIESLPMATSYILIQVYLSFDMIMLSFTHGEKTVGLYCATYKIITMLNMFGIYYFMTLFPNVSRLYVQSREKMQILLQTSLKHSISIALPICVGGTLLADPIITFIYGAKYSGSILPLRILVWNIGVIWISLHYGNTLIACNRQNRYLAGVSLGALSNIILNLIFIPLYGMPAAAATTVFSEIIVFMFMYRELQKIIKLRFFILSIKPLLASAVMGGWIFLEPEWNVLIRILAGALFYFPVLYLAGGFNQEDLNRIKHIIDWKHEWKKESLS